MEGNEYSGGLFRWEIVKPSPDTFFHLVIKDRQEAYTLALKLF